MSFLRKASLSRKKGLGESASPKSSPLRGDRPPRSGTHNDTDSVTGEAADGGVKRKVSLGHKSRKRISSLFSSSSHSSHHDRDRDPATSPQQPQSDLNASTTSSSRTSSPTHEAHSPPQSAKYNGLGAKGTPPDANGLAGDVGNLRVDPDAVPVTESPETTSPTAAKTVPGPPEQATLTDGATKRLRHEKTASLYSQWDEDGDVDDASSGDDAEFLTPSEGLSEVEEEPDEAGAVANPTLDETNVEKGAVATNGHVGSTGTSTIHRTIPKTSETHVRRRIAHAKHDALAVDQAEVLPRDLDVCREALRLFLTSRIKEAEDLCIDKDPDGNHLYLISGHAIIQALKGMMTFDAHDLSGALEICKATTITASATRKSTESIVSRLGGIVRPGQGVARIKSMTVVERHAELVWAETTLMKAMLAIIAGGDWLGLVKEAFNMRSAHITYQTLKHYTEEADRHGFDEDIDMDFRSGVLLGTGTSSLMLSLLPGKVLKIAEVFGYGGDRKAALEDLMSAGGWTKGSKNPAYDEKNEGVRRPVCDLILLTYHLVISVLMPVDRVDIGVARDILAYNMRRYPDGVFFLYFQARLHTTQCEPELANQSLQKALDLELEYIQLQHMCLWDYAGNFLMLANWKGALDCYNILKDESNWSRAVYTYSAATCIIDLVEDGDSSVSLDEADRLMKAVPTLTKRIAGKSLPIEKLVSRKARKFESQGRRLLLPALELAYVFGALSHTPRRHLLEMHLPRIDKMLQKLSQSSPEAYGKGNEYWDDFCLGHFLRGVVQFSAVYQPAEAVKSVNDHQPGDPKDADIDRDAEKDFLEVLRHGPDVQLDHYIIYHCHYELGRLYARRGSFAEAKKNFDVIMSGKLLEANPNTKKPTGKYSLEGALQLKTHAALQSLKDGQAK